VTTATAGPGRHRSAAADEAILAATLELLTERGYGGLTMISVIDRAGVSSATLYRRWPTKHDLVVAAVASVVPSSVDTDTGTLAGDLAALLGSIAASIAARREDIAESLAMETKHNAELAAALRDKFLVPRVAQIDAIVRRATARGELCASPSGEMALSLVAGPVYHRAFVLGEPLTPAFLRRAVSYAQRGLGAVPCPVGPPRA
jgi:AcrR family transcriptional regulator